MSLNPEGQPRTRIRTPASNVIDIFKRSVFLKTRLYGTFPVRFGRRRVISRAAGHATRAFERVLVFIRTTSPNHSHNSTDVSTVIERRTAHDAQLDQARLAGIRLFRFLTLLLGRFQSDMHDRRVSQEPLDTCACFRSLDRPRLDAVSTTLP